MTRHARRRDMRGHAILRSNGKATCERFLLQLDPDQLTLEEHPLPQAR